MDNHEIRFGDYGLSSSLRSYFVVSSTVICCLDQCYRIHVCSSWSRRIVSVAFLVFSYQLCRLFWSSRTSYVMAASASGAAAVAASSMPGGPASSARASISASPIAGEKRSRLPPAPITGDHCKDEIAVNQMEFLQEMVDGCLNHMDHIVPLYSAYKKRKALVEADSATGTTTSERFVNTTTLWQLWKNYPEFVMWWVSTRSDLTVQELGISAKTHPDSPFHLMLAALQVDSSMRLTLELQVREVFVMWANKRSSDQCDRIAQFKGKGGFVGDVLSWANGAYKVTESEGFMHQLTHNASGAVTDISQYRISKVYKLQNNWSDKKASFELEGNPPIDVKRYFSKGVGPKAAEPFSAASSDFASSVQLHFRAWKQQREAVRQAHGNATMQAASALVKTNDKQRRLDNMKKAQATAKANNAKKKTSTAVTVLDADQPDAPAP